MKRTPEIISFTFAVILVISTTIFGAFVIDIKDYQVLIGSCVAVLAALIAYSAASLNTRFQQIIAERELQMQFIPIGMEYYFDVTEISWLARNYFNEHIGTDENLSDMDIDQIIERICNIDVEKMTQPERIKHLETRYITALYEIQRNIKSLRAMRNEKDYDKMFLRTEYIRDTSNELQRYFSKRVGIVTDSRPKSWLSRIRRSVRMRSLLRRVRMASK